MDNDGVWLGIEDGWELTDGASLGFEVGEPVSVGTCDGWLDGCVDDGEAEKLGLGVGAPLRLGFDDEDGNTDGAKLG